MKPHCDKKTYKRIEKTNHLSCWYVFIRVKSNKRLSLPNKK